MWCIHALDQRSASERTGIPPPAVTQVNLEDAVLGDVSQSHQVQYHMILLYEVSPEGSNSQGQKVGWWCRGWGRGRGRKSLVHGDRVSVWDDGNVLDMDGDYGCTTL